MTMGLLRLFLALALVGRNFRTELVDVFNRVLRAAFSQHPDNFVVRQPYTRLGAMLRRQIIDDYLDCGMDSDTHTIAPSRHLVLAPIMRPMLHFVKYAIDLSASLCYDKRIDCTALDC